MRLTGRTALVTGGGQGIGRGIAHALAAQGAAVVISGRTRAKLESVRDELLSFGATAAVSVGDVGDRSDVDGMVATAIERFGRLDILVNNAQTMVQRLLEEATDPDVALCYESGPLATLHCMQAALPHLKVRGGCIVNLGSNTAVTGDASFGPYAMAKEAIRGLTRVAAREWGPCGIRVNCICPTALSPSAQEFAATNPEQFAGYLRQIPLGRMGDPEADIGHAVASLVSDDMAYLTGCTLMLGGGRVMI